MHDPSPSGRIALAELMAEYALADVPLHSLQLVAEGASGRCIMRCVLPACAGIIGIYWTPERPDNASFLPAAFGLRAAGVHVPEIYASRAYDDGCGACLAEDLGEQSLLSLRNAPREERMAAYRSALRTMQSFHSVSPNWELQPPFDANLYSWEQKYFAEHLLGRHLGHPAATSFHNLPECRQIADFLAKQPLIPIHRDFQSQNIIIHNGEAFCIDFQGMRLGLSEYDVASLLYDPYVDLAQDEREELLSYLAKLPGPSTHPFLLQACALQRLMQALGAFANIGHNHHRSWYLQLIPTGLRILRNLCSSVPDRSPAYPLAACLTSVIS